MSDLAVWVDWDLSVDRTRLFDEVAVGFLLGYDKAHTPFCLPVRSPLFRILVHPDRYRPVGRPTSTS